MPQTKTLEECHLAAADRVLRKLAASSRDPGEARTQYLEAVSSRIGGFPLSRYHQLMGVDRLSGLDLDNGASTIVAAIAPTPVPPALALAALARPEHAEVERKQAGSWNTDWRLAQTMASTITSPRSRILLDPACGTGALLVAVSLRQHDAHLRNRFLAEHVCGTDLDPRAIRGASLALASLTSDLGAIRCLTRQLRVADALIAPEKTWHDRLLGGQLRFDAVIGNPPWERLRVTRHEHLVASGHAIHYGDAIDDALVADAGEIEERRAQLSSYRRGVSARFDLQGRGGADLYKLFTELALRLLPDGGELSWLLPGGIIRSQGTTELRSHLLERCRYLRMTVFSNTGRFFDVYRRQKFVLVEATVGTGAFRALELRHGHGTADSVAMTRPTPIARAALRGLRDDLAVPEVRSRAAWSTYLQLARAGGRVRDWKPEFLREVDMSLDRKWFLTRPRSDAVALIEGRMVHQYRHDAKRYRAGTGRAARWEAPPAHSDCAPTGQYWMPVAQLSDAARARIDQHRIGFCDITGQTNERGMLCALIPRGYACGNKVPTITFNGSHDPLDVGLAFMAIANSLAFDWVLRRMISTSVNYFLLRDLPWPELAPDSLPARRLAALARQLSRCAHTRTPEMSDPIERQKLRLEIELLVAEIWNISFSGMHEILDDFPLLDGGCPPLSGEQRSTITRDAVLLRLGERESVSVRVLRVLRDRVERAEALGAIAFMPTQFTDTDFGEERAAV